MEILIFVLALAMFAGAVVLLAMDRRRRGGSAAPGDDAMIDDSLTGPADDGWLDAPDADEGDHSGAARARPRRAIPAESAAEPAAESAQPVRGEARIVGAARPNGVPAMIRRTPGRDDDTGSRRGKGRRRRGRRADSEDGESDRGPFPDEDGGEFAGDAAPAALEAGDDGMRDDGYVDAELVDDGDTGADDADDTAGGVGLNTDEDEPSEDPNRTGDTPATDGDAAAADDAAADDDADLHDAAGREMEGASARHPRAVRTGPFAGLADRLRFPRHGRRARRAWAREINGEYTRADPRLSAVWARTPEGQARDVVSGFAYGSELRLADVGGRTVIALRRDAGSDVVLEFARDRGDGLSLVEEVPGGSVASTDPVLVRRLLTAAEIDSVRRMPGCVEALWAEGEWAIALLARESGPEQWEEALPAVAEFSGVARRLPPTDGGRSLDPATWDPTRPRAGDAGTDRDSADRGAPAGAAGPMDRHLRAVPDAPAASPAEPQDEDPVWRPAPVAPAEPVDMPSRSVGRRMGDGEFRDLGSGAGDSASELPALGQDPDHVRAPRTGVRVLRDGDAPSGIFGDGPAVADPAAGDPGEDRPAGPGDRTDNDDTEQEGTKR
ncbi:hypothetical protein [Corynebacterium sp.]|uniref:hypothetical protein n=1 Tax=Corynebacterium sp. TaxID=1720 RepID=UPI0026DCADC5|nr:hypothetical protein [Corynebacterium sp.]MDO4610610.1 hypothetical protein [Corynebacterium sp.]